MSLQIRRGTEGQRGAVTFDAGEIVFTTDTHKLYVGDGSTAGGVNVLASAAGNGISWNATTQQLDFAGTLSGFTTNNLAEGTTNKYYHQATAQADVAAMFIPYGTPTVVGQVSGVVTPNLITLSTVTGLIALAPITFTGTGGAAYGLTAGTYWITSVNSGSSQITLSSTLAYAQTGTSDVSIVSTHSVAGVAFTAGQGASATPDDSNIAFTYNPVTKTMQANVTLDGVGILSVGADTSPQLGGNLNLNTFTINGTGSINFTGNIQNTGNLITSGSVAGGTVSATAGNIVLNPTSITSTLAFNAYSADTHVQTTSNLVPFGNAATPATLYINSASDAGVYVKGFSTGPSTSATIKFAMSRGSQASPTPTQANDAIGGIVFNGYDGSGFINGAAIQSNAISVTSGIISASLSIGVKDNAGSLVRYTFSPSILTAPAVSVGDGSASVPSITFTTDSSNDTGFFHPGDGIVAVTANGTEKARFDSGGFRTTGFSKVGSFAGSGTYPSPAEAGMIIFDSNTSHFVGYNGTTWKQLDN
jgi:hypothetical protein